MEETGGSSIQDIVLGVGGLGGIIWALYEKWMRHKVQSANVDSNVAVAGANEALFTMLTTRLTSLEEEVKTLRAELSREREYTRTLIGMMITSGMTPPAYPLPSQ